MPNGKIYYNNSVRDCTLTAPETAGFETGYLTDSNPGTVWRSTGQTADIVFTFPAAVTIKAVVILNHNLITGDTFIFQGSNSPSFTTHSEISIDVTTGFAEIDFDDFTYYRLRLNRTTGDYCQAGQIFLAQKTYEFEQNYGYNFATRHEVSWLSKTTPSGQTYRSRQYVRKGFSLEFELITGGQKTIFEEISENDYSCFLPEGIDGPIYFGTVDFSDFKCDYVDSYSASLSFTENPA
jgi:hypothetical protein